MTNVVQLQNYREDFNANSPIFFPVKTVAEIDIIDQDGRSFNSDGFQAVVNEDTGDTIGIHGSSYKLTPNAEIFPAFDEALKTSSLDLTDLKVKDEISHDGGRTFRQYFFPAHMAAVKDSSDEIMLRLLVNTSYDGSSALKFQFGAFRMVCSNGMIVGTKFAQAYGKNTLNLKVNRIVTQLAAGIKGYLDETQQWIKWASNQITDAQATSVIQALPGINKKLEEKLQLMWKDEKDELGATQWALFNALTYWSSHDEVRQSREANRPSIINQREERVRRTITSRPFLALAA
tara:strand:+ start:10562 stop:11431 length:870 start_codon:yes stop_codon:yes gene_type:complete